MRAFYVEATERYQHGVLGDRIEAGGVVVQTGDDIAAGRCGTAVILPKSSVFEDTSPRLSDLDGDGNNELIVVETNLRLGAQLAVYGLRNGKLHKLAATQNIGQAFRWLAPVGIADFNGDGQNDVAYVETPHLGKILRVVTFENGELIQIAAVKGVTNHRIGDAAIAGGVRMCGGTPEMVTANNDWTRVYATRFEGNELSTLDLGPLTSSRSFQMALSCR